METEETKKREEQLKAIVLDPKTMGQNWLVKRKITNSQGIKAFGGHMLTAYTHPLTGKRAPLRDVDGNEIVGYMLDKPSKMLNNKIPADRIIIDWLLANPEVGVEGIDMTDAIGNKKIGNPKVIMINLDRQELGHMEEQDIIDRVLGRLSDNTTSGLGIKKVRYLMAEFNLPYFDARYITNATTEKRVLLSQLKNFARKKNAQGKLNAILIENVLDEVESLKYGYEFRECLRFGIIKENFGSYKYNNVPIGSTVESGIAWMKSTPVMYQEIQAALYPKLKADGFMKEKD